MNLRFAPFALCTCLALSLAAPVFAEDPDKAEVNTYLEEITKTHTRLNQAGQKFGVSLGPALKGGEKEQLAVYRTYRELAQLIWKIQQETKEFEVPDHELAREVKSANDRFLIYQREVVLSKIPAMLELIDDANLEVAAKAEKLQAMIGRDNEREVELGKVLRDSMTKLREAAK